MEFPDGRVFPNMALQRALEGVCVCVGVCVLGGGTCPEIPYHLEIPSKHSH